MSPTREHQLESSSSTLPVGKILSTLTVIESPKAPERPRLRPSLFFAEHHQEGDHVRGSTTHVKPGSSFIGSVLVSPMRGPWPSVGGYKYPLFPESQVFIFYTPIHFFPAHSVSHFSIRVSCRYPPSHSNSARASRDGPSLIR